MIIKIIGHNGLIFKKPATDNPWSFFFEQLETNGHSLATNLNDPIFDVLVMNSYLKEKKVGLSKKNKHKIKKILILWEPKQVNPKLYKKSHLAKYDHIFTPSELWVDTPNTQIFKWPQGVTDKSLEPKATWTRRENKTILISGNKYSVVNGELYSFRRNIIEKCSQANILDFGGVGWNQNKIVSIYLIVKSFIKSRLKNLSFGSLINLFPNLIRYIGPISNKDLTQSEYKVSLVIENSLDYISEKLFDALSSQNIVVYVGVDISRFGLNEKMVIQSEKNIEYVCNILISLLALDPNDQYKLMREQQKEYRKIVKNWGNNFVLNDLANSINKLLI
jgi:hypothetical protein